MESNKLMSALPECRACQDNLVVPVVASCCGVVLCDKCWRLLASCSSYRNVCSYCHQANPEVRPTGNNAALCCPIRYCEKELTAAQYSEHVAYTCEMKLTECQFCKSIVSAGKLIKHCSEQHPNQLIECLMGPLSQTQSRIQQLKTIYESGEVAVKLNQSYTNDRGAISRFGSTGKLYCGQPLETKNCSCDGYCGPTNGCSCLSCMRLNLQFRGALGSRCLINNCGILSKISEDNRPYCGQRLTRNTEEYCSPVRRCGNCEYLERHRFMDKYISLLK